MAPLCGALGAIPMPAPVATRVARPSPRTVDCPEYRRGKRGFCIMGEVGIGQPVRRVEDTRLLHGHGRYINDVNLPGQAYAVILRSPHAHARFTAIDTAAAKAAPG